MFVLGAPAAARAVVGVQGPSFDGANATTPPSGPKPESKLWFNDGSWWGYLFDGPAGQSQDFHIFRFDAGSETWVDTGVAGDTRNNTTADVLWDGTKLYVASHAQSDSTTKSGSPAYLYRYSYATSTDTYSLDGGFPVQINNMKTETLAIAKDSTGKLWATWTEDGASDAQNTVKVDSTVCSPGCSDSTWGTPFALAVPAPADDDISSVIAFGGNKVGLMWSNQSTNGMYFAVHVDGDADTAWAVETATSGTGIADDHINLKTDSSGRIFAATKTSLSGSGALNRLLVRTASGTWVTHVFGLGTDNHTRPIVLLDDESGLIRMFATSGQSGGKIYEKTLPFAQAETPGVDFAPGVGTVFIDDGGADLNNSTSTKQNLDASTGILVLATNKQDTKTYWHRYVALTPDTDPPEAQTAEASGATLTISYDESLDPASVPANGDFAVGGGHAVTAVSVTGTDVVLALAPAVLAGESGLTVSYTPGASPLQDMAGNDAAALVSQAVTNSTGSGPLTLVANADVSASDVRVSGATNLFDAIDEGVASANDGDDLIRNNRGVSAAYVAGLTDTPDDFGSMATLTADVRARSSNWTDDQLTLVAQVFRADGTTPLTDEVTLTTAAASSGWTTVTDIPFTGVVAADKAAWDGALLKLRWVYTAVGGGDGAQLKVTAVELDGTSAPSGPDLTPPAFQSASVDGAALTMAYGEALDGGSTPDGSAFTVNVNASPVGVSNVSVAGSAVTVTLASAVVSSDVVTVAYAVPGTSPLQDVAGNDAAALPETAVTNTTSGGGNGSLTLTPNGDGTIDAGIRDKDHATTDLYASIDEGLATTNDGDDYVCNNNKTSGSYFVQLTATPAGFGQMQTLAIGIRARTTGLVDDETTMYAQLFQADGATPLSDEVVVAVNPGPSGFTTVADIALTGLVGGSKAIWDGAQVRLRWAYTAVGAQDSTQLRLSTVELAGTY